MKRILITGSNGLLGQKLIHLLQQQADIEIIATSRGSNRIHNTGGFQYFTMDITNPHEVSSVFERTQPNLVIHTAAMTKVEDCEKSPDQAKLINIEGTRHLLKAAETCQAFFLYISTDFVFDGKTGMYHEEDKPNPPNFYGETKLAAEQLVQESNISWAIARTILVYGISEDMSRSNIILWVKNSLSQQKEIRVVEDQWRTPTLAEDLAMGCWLIAKKMATGIFHISGKDLLTPYDIAIETSKVFNLDQSLISPTNASEFIEIGKRPAKTGFDISKAQNKLGYQPHSFQEGLNFLKQQLESVKPN